MITDLTAVHDHSGPARLLDVVARRPAAVLVSWLANQPPTFGEQVEVVAMDGFGGYKTAATDQLLEATSVMGPFHVAALTGASSIPAEAINGRSDALRRNALGFRNLTLAQAGGPRRSGLLPALSNTQSATVREKS